MFANTLEQYSHLRKIDYSSAKLLNEKEKQTIIKNIMSTAKKQRNEQKSVFFEINAIGSLPQPILREDFLDSVFSIDFDNKKDVLKIKNQIEGVLDEQTVESKLPDILKEDKSYKLWVLNRYTFTEENVWANYKVFEIFNGNRKKIWTWGNGIQTTKIDAERGSLNYSGEMNQVTVSDNNARYDAFGFFFDFFFLPFHDDKTSGNLPKTFVEIYKDNNYLYLLFRKNTKSYIDTLMCCDTDSYNVIVYRIFDKNGDVLSERFQFNWTKVDRGISAPKKTIEARYDLDTAKRGNEKLSYYSINYLQNIDQFPVFKKEEFQLACKEGTKLLCYRGEKDYKLFVLDRDVSDVLDYTFTINPSSAKKVTNVFNDIAFEDMIVRIILITAGIMSLAVAVLIRIYQKKYTKERKS
ncbi:MAG: hypothetical protein LBC68_02305 [Prevotellaceae bacterium]|nr:hypothetical protein [Prevotellaceae bacterium]